MTMVTPFDDAARARPAPPAEEAAPAAAPPPAADFSSYLYRDEVIPSLGYMLPVVRDIVAREFGARRVRVFELGCGKGDMAAALATDGHRVCGVDPSESGIALARAHYPGLALHQGSSADDLAAVHGQFDVVLSIDVIEYAYDTRGFVAAMRELVAPGGIVIVSAPFHGYLKNIAIALSGSMDRHFNSLQPFGRIKFWSEDTLGALLREAGFSTVTFRRTGRVPALAKAMFATARL